MTKEIKFMMFRSLRNERIRAGFAMVEAMMVVVAVVVALLSATTMLGNKTSELITTAIGSVPAQ